MPVSVVVGGQYGSEGKGKISYWLSQRRDAAAVVRVGGPNSGHTNILPSGERVVFRQLPTPSTIPGVVSVLPAGSYLDSDLLVQEVRAAGLSKNQLVIDPNAVVMSRCHREEEVKARLGETIGSTKSGVGAAVAERVWRRPSLVFAKDHPVVAGWTSPATEFLRGLLRNGRRVIIEGTQGFGLSLLHGGHYPYATSREVSAAGALAEAGLSPLDVDEIVLVLRAFPIRVGGNSGPLVLETDWETVTRSGNHDHALLERTTVTRSVRRVARFSPDIVVRALEAISPTLIALNHLDYIDHSCCLSGEPTRVIDSFVQRIEDEIDHRVDLWGLGENVLLECSEVVGAAGGV